MFSWSPGTPARFLSRLSPSHAYFRRLRSFHAPFWNQRAISARPIECSRSSKRQQAMRSCSDENPLGRQKSRYGVAPIDTIRPMMTRRIMTASVHRTPSRSKAIDHLVNMHLIWLYPDDRRHDEKGEKEGKGPTVMGFRAALNPVLGRASWPMRTACAP